MLEIPDAGARSADEAIERREMIACYLEYVGQLPPAAYEVYVLSEFEGLSDVSRGSPRRIPSHSLNVSTLAQAASREGPAAAVLPGRRS
jgi:hypothetical protein